MYKALSAPKSSIPIKVQAIGVLVAPAKTATKPIPASNATGSGKNINSALPKVAPIKNNGVTSPPLKPTPKVKAVISNLIAKSEAGKLMLKASTMVGIPSPINFVEPIKNTKSAMKIPPIKGRSGGYEIILDEKDETK